MSETVSVVSPDPSGEQQVRVCLEDAEKLGISVGKGEFSSVMSRQDGNQNGMVKSYEIYLSTDGKNWGSPVVSGQFINTTALQTATLKTPTAGRYLKLVAKSEINGRAWSSAAEIGIEADGDVTAVNSPKTRINAKSGPIYDLQGRRLSDNRPQKGLFIQDGKVVAK